METKDELVEFIDAVELSRSGKEGIVILGCGGELKEWTEGITNHLVENKVLPEGTSDEDVWKEVFRMKSTGGRIDIAMIFGSNLFNMGRMAMWRLRWNGEISWLSDFVENYQKHYNQ